MRTISRGLPLGRPFQDLWDWDRFSLTQARAFSRSSGHLKSAWDLIVNQNFFVEKMLPGSVARELTNAELQHYRESYPTLESRKPLLALAQ